MIKKAFTLAEVLIVIALIGTVAALTVPNLSDSYKDENTVVKLRKFQNELKTSYQQAILKYGDSFENQAGSQRIASLYEFLETSESASFPVLNLNRSWYTRELKDASIISMYQTITDNVVDIYIATNGKNSSTVGKDIFRFGLNVATGEIIPKGRGNDRGTNNALSLGGDNINGTNWAVSIGNLDYLKCASSLNWETKTTCD